MTELNSGKSGAVVLRENERIVRDRTALFGLVRWQEFVSAKTIGNTLNVYASVDVDEVNIFINGKKVESLKVCK